jgi:hypothetical protein
MCGIAGFLGQGDSETLKRMTDEAMGVVMRSEDIGEGLTAFIEKRPSTGSGLRYPFNPKNKLTAILHVQKRICQNTFPKIHVL